MAVLSLDKQAHIWLLDLPGKVCIAVVYIRRRAVPSGCHFVTLDVDKILFRKMHGERVNAAGK